MAATKRPSPCCNAPSLTRFISMRNKQLVLRCSKCGLLRVEPVSAPKRPRLTLIVSR